MARPKLPIKEEQVIELAKIGCTYAEMAAVLGCDPSTLTKRFSHAIKEGHANMKLSLRRKQFEVAMSGDRTMLIWLGKQHLEQREKSEINSSNNVQIDHSPLLEIIKDWPSK